MAPKKNRTSVVKDRNTGEWVVKVYENGKYNEDKTYYAMDKEDALATQADMEARGLGGLVPKKAKLPLALTAAAGIGAFLMHLWMKKKGE